MAVLKPADTSANGVLPLPDVGSDAPQSTLRPSYPDVRFHLLLAEPASGPENRAISGYMKGRDF
jgi:hypothetical protein